MSPARTTLAQAQALEQSGDLTAAIGVYQAALAQDPDDPTLLAGIARLADRMQLPAVAAQFWRNLYNRDPDDIEAVDGLARALRDQHLYADAIAVLQAVIPRHAGDSRLWNTLGGVLHQQGDADQALVFFEEAARIDPASAVAVYNRGGVKFDLGRLDEAAADFRSALALSRSPSTTAMARFATALLQLAQGDLRAGWEGYETRLSPHHPAHVVFEGAGEPWTPETPLRGRRVLVFAEQGLGDEVMFANLVPDLLEEIGAAGRLHLAVEPRLVDLFRRSFPGADITAHETERLAGVPHRRAPGVAGVIEVWAPLASLARRYRQDLQAFPPRPSYLAADPGRIRFWRQWLGEGRTVGLSWRSGQLTGERRRNFPALEAWAPILAAPGVRFVSMQYGATEEELAVLGIPSPPGIDLKNDLDDLAALSCALDRLISVPNATAAIAAASGAAVTFLAAPFSWARLGTGAYPWYPSATGFSAPSPGAWAEPISRIAASLAP